MNNLLKNFKEFKIDTSELRKHYGNDLYNLSQIKPVKVYASDVISTIVRYLNKEISTSQLTEWVNIIWFTDLFEYNPNEEDSIASVMSLLETLDEPETHFSDNDYTKMIVSLKNNQECKI